MKKVQINDNYFRTLIINTKITLLIKPALKIECNLHLALRDFTQLMLNEH